MLAVVQSAPGSLRPGNQSALVHPREAAAWHLLYCPECAKDWCPADVGYRGPAAPGAAPDTPPVLPGNGFWLRCYPMSSAPDGPGRPAPVHAKYAHSVAVFPRQYPALPARTLPRQSDETDGSGPFAAARGGTWALDTTVAESGCTAGRVVHRRARS